MIVCRQQFLGFIDQDKNAGRYAPLLGAVVHLDHAPRQRLQVVRVAGNQGVQQMCRTAKVAGGNPKLLDVYWMIRKTFLYFRPCGSIFKVRYELSIRFLLVCQTT